MGSRILMAALAAVIVGAGAAVAVGGIPGTGGTISACYAKNNGALRVVDAEAGKTCSTSKELALDWNQTGPPGPQGEPGPQGPAGAGLASLDELNGKTCMLQAYGGGVVREGGVVVNPGKENQGQGMGDITLTCVSDDSNEPNNAYSSPTELGAPNAMGAVGTIYPENDVDWYGYTGILASIKPYSVNVYPGPFTLDVFKDGIQVATGVEEFVTGDTDSHRWVIEVRAQFLARYSFFLYTQ